MLACCLVAWLYLAMTGARIRPWRCPSDMTVGSCRTGLSYSSESSLIAAIAVASGRSGIGSRPAFAPSHRTRC